ncbi:hypothetical protein FW774_03970 (plasmid) [Pedobacter sp. BS3]|uniref:hypothetical protein n=1 Tax=Pedobacter sp. BS3 TaxID=2567937 RepID=UPI0011EF15B0|nr:hypothetical protein [Pedobacter sp. BS3]TZF86216.1 hypothetical protein FW774_03970 [Pedobacter sp. BS3]
MNKFRSPGKEGTAIFVLGIIYAIMSYNTLLTISAIIVPFILMKLVWRKGDSPILFFALLAQWVAVSIKVFYANYTGVDFITVHDYPEHIEAAFYLGLIGLIALAIGIHIQLRTLNLEDKGTFTIRESDYNYSKLLRTYLICSFSYPILYALSFTLGGLQQPLSKFVEFKWAIFFLFMLYSFNTGRYKLFILVACYDIIISLTGYFSGFKDYFFALFIGMIIVFGKRLKPKHIIPLALILTIGTYFLMIWQHVKPEYRKFLSGGAEAQISVRGTQESLAKLLSLVLETDQEGIEDGFEYTVARLSYIDFLSATMSNVPENVPHTNGKLWTGAFTRILQPRLLFPNKEVIDDSEKASLYTGTEFYGADKGTSVSLGYFAESYVDFGMIGMHIILLVFGFIIGSIYKFVIQESPDIVVGSALVLPMFYVINSFETALDKIVGALCMYFVMYLLVKTVFLKPLLNYLKS